MCGCQNNINVVDLTHLNIYLVMANYKVKKQYKDTATFFKGVRIDWNNASEEQIAWVYEEVDNGSHYVEKIDKTNKSNNEESTIKESKKKGKSSKKNNEEK
jgi:hypothetical protein